MGMSFPFGVIKMSWNSKEVMTVQHCECIKCYWIVQFKMVKMVNLSYVNFTSIQKKYIGAGHSGFLRMQPAPLTSPHHSPVSCLLVLEAGFPLQHKDPLGLGLSLNWCKNGIDSSAPGWGSGHTSPGKLVLVLSTSGPLGRASGLAHWKELSAWQSASLVWRIIGVIYD